MDFNRICIYPKDVQIITGRTERYGRKLLKEIRKVYKKEDHHFVSIDEFCSHTGLSVEQVNSRLSR